MNKKYISIGAISALLLIGGGVLAWQFSQDSDNGSSRASAEQISTDFLTLSKYERDLSCSFDIVEESTLITGTVYTSGGNMRGTYTTNILGAQNTFDIIRNSSNTYVWEEEGSIAYVYENDQFEQYVAEAADQTTGDVFNVEDGIDFECESWTPDNARFNPPSDVEFQDITQQVNSTLESVDLDAAGLNSLDDIDIEQIKQNACANIEDENFKQFCEESVEQNQ